MRPSAVTSLRPVASRSRPSPAESGSSSWRLARRIGLGVRHFVSLGNKADVSSNDLLAAWLEDPGVTAAALYLESFGNSAKFARVARRFSERKPLLAVVGGRSGGGQRAGASHTAAAATPSVRRRRPVRSGGRHRMFRRRRPRADRTPPGRAATPARRSGRGGRQRRWPRRSGGGCAGGRGGGGSRAVRGTPPRPDPTGRRNARDEQPGGRRGSRLGRVPGPDPRLPVGDRRGGLRARRPGPHADDGLGGRAGVGHRGTAPPPEQDGARGAPRRRPRPVPAGPDDPAHAERRGRCPPSRDQVRRVDTEAARAAAAGRLRSFDLGLMPGPSGDSSGLGPGGSRWTRRESLLAPYGVALDRHPRRGYRRRGQGSGGDRPAGGREGGGPHGRPQRPSADWSGSDSPPPGRWLRQPRRSAR